MTGSNSLFEGRYRPRQRLDVKVGKFHTLETLVHVPHKDWEYFQQHANPTEEFLEVLQEQVLPRMFGTELEAFHRAKYPGVLPPENHEYCGDAAAAPAGKGGKGKGKKKRATAPKSKKGEKPSKKRKGNNNSGKTTAQKVKALEDEDGIEKKEKDVYYSFGDTIQLAYRREPTTQCYTIFFDSKEKSDEGGDSNNNNKPSSSSASGFHDYIKLSHRLVIWISKLNENQKTNPDAKGVGFYRPEMIPMSTLFRQPKDVLQDDSDDDNDDDDN